MSLFRNQLSLFELNCVIFIYFLVENKELLAVWLIGIRKFSAMAHLR